MSAFERGALVRLKSGGPTMTVDKLPGEDSGYSKLTLRGREKIIWTRYRCVWFQGNELKSDDFAEHLLTPASDQ